MVKNIAVDTTSYHGQNNQTPSFISLEKFLHFNNWNLDK